MDFTRSIGFFYKNMVDSLLDDEDSDASFKLMMAATSIIHEHTERQMPMHRG
jgi:hypothetical protein